MVNHATLRESIAGLKRLAVCTLSVRALMATRLELCASVPPSDSTASTLFSTHFNRPVHTFPCP